METGRKKKPNTVTADTLRHVFAGSQSAPTDFTKLSLSVTDCKKCFYINSTGLGVGISLVFSSAGLKKVFFSFCQSETLMKTLLKSRSRDQGHIFLTSIHEISLSERRLSSLS